MLKKTPENRQFGRLSHLFYPLTFAFKMLSLVLPSVRNFIKRERKEDQRQTLLLHQTRISLPRITKDREMLKSSLCEILFAQPLLNCLAGSKKTLQGGNFTLPLIGFHTHFSFPIFPISSGAVFSKVKENLTTVSWYLVIFKSSLVGLRRQ